jgi:hypothetical protein
MSTDDKNRFRKTYSFFRSPPVFASTGGGGGGGSTAEQFWHSTTPGSIYTTGSVIIRGGDSGYDSPTDVGTNVFFYVSGSAFTGSDVSLLGGDLFVSGSLVSFADLIEVTGSIIATLGFTGSLTQLPDGSPYVVAGPNVTIATSSAGAIEISSSYARDLQLFAGTAASSAASGTFESLGMIYFDPAEFPAGSKSVTFSAILASTVGTTAYVDLYDYDGIISAPPDHVSGSVLTGSNPSYTYLTKQISDLETVTSAGIIEARLWCSPTGSGLNAICKNAKLTVRVN